jgi:hypothetical protein
MARITVWTDEKMAELKREWYAVPEKTLKMIAQTMGLGPNQIHNKVIRMRLKPRPNPVKPKSDNPPRAKSIRKGRATLAPLSSLS